MNLDENIDNNSTEITIKIRTLDKEFSIQIQNDSTIKALKEKIATVNIIIYNINIIKYFFFFFNYQIPVDKQRLIFRGHVLEDSKLITENKIENEDVVHLIARMESNNTNSNNNNEETRNSNIDTGFFSTFFRAGPPPFFPFPHFRETMRSGWGPSNYRIISSTYSNYGRSNSEYAPQPTINSDEIRETIAQNILEVQNIIDFGNYNEFKENNNEENEKMKIEEKKEEKEEIYDMNCFDLNKRILYKGQWVDVKDTVEQWLDAQVIEVSEDNKMVKIHYNHWSTRWDEWINTSSPRIMPFRYHTRQITLTNYNSPFPNKKPDMGVSLLSFENLNRNGCLHPSSYTQIIIAAIIVIIIQITIIIVKIIITVKIIIIVKIIIYRIIHRMNHQMPQMLLVIKIRII